MEMGKYEEHFSLMQQSYMKSMNLLGHIPTKVLMDSEETSLILGPLMDELELLYAIDSEFFHDVKEGFIEQFVGI